MCAFCLSVHNQASKCPGEIQRDEDSPQAETQSSGLVGSPGQNSSRKEGVDSEKQAGQ